MARTRFVSNESGFTLIEVMIAIAIFAIGLMAMGALQSSALMATGNVSRKGEAWALVEEQAELLKGMQFYTDVPTQTHPAELNAGGFGGPRSVARANGRYNIQWQVVDDDPIGQQNESVLPGVPVGSYTVSKRITVVAIRPGGNPLNPLAEVEFVKVWWATGVP
jgi:type IV pilus assembly protein PilV